MTPLILIMGAIKTHSFKSPFRLIKGRSINHAVVSNWLDSLLRYHPLNSLTR